MRKRNVEILFRLTRREAQELDKKVKKSGLSREAFLRAMIEGYQLHEKPGSAFYETMRQMSAIGNNLNQIAAKANALGFVDQPLYEKEALKWRKFQTEVKEKFLVPEKSGHGHHKNLGHPGPSGPGGGLCQKSR